MWHSELLFLLRHRSLCINGNFPIRCRLLIAFRYLGFTQTVRTGSQSIKDKLILRSASRLNARLYLVTGIVQLEEHEVCAFKRFSFFVHLIDEEFRTCIGNAQNTGDGLPLDGQITSRQYALSKFLDQRIILRRVWEFRIGLMRIKITRRLNPVFHNQRTDGRAGNTVKGLSQPTAVRIGPRLLNRLTVFINRHHLPFWLGGRLRTVRHPTFAIPHSFNSGMVAVGLFRNDVVVFILLIVFGIRVRR